MCIIKRYNKKTKEIQYYSGYDIRNTDFINWSKDILYAIRVPSKLIANKIVNYLLIHKQNLDYKFYITNVTK